VETFIFETIRDEGPRHEWKRIQELVEKADRSLKAVERLRQSEDNDFAISRAYYAMFYYVVQALLLRGDHRRNKHSGVIAALTIFRKNRQDFFTFFILLRDGFEDGAEENYGIAPISPDQGRAGNFCRVSLFRIRQSLSGLP
jgi:uncharacterized protein (UPF0332 family)